ncbi:hypothetical protein NQ317_003919 [Molorchus minor]|uniref:Androglobin domain-containing protein n=1 Tax=Molorchus minor TaxID=1323400 RepID=A0ABQ9J8D0_9CUCU|nr:hypothetical protein NQ317_003919 [Molorchus minor]
MAEIRKKYPLNDDLENRLSTRSVFLRTIGLFICRQLFFVNSLDPVLVKINLFCDVNSYIVRVIDNDTKIELKRYTNNVTVNEYSCNVNGYTVLCYGWSDVAKEIRCKLTFAIKKEINENKLIVPPLTTQVDVITGNYIPNFNNYICRYFVQVPSDKVLLTVRFWTSYDEVLVNLRLLDDYGVLIEEVTGKKNIVMPAVVLEFYEKEKPKNRQ